MEISGSQFIRSHQIYQWVKAFTIEVARLANYLDQVTQRLNLILSVIHFFSDLSEEGWNETLKRHPNTKTAG